MGNLQFPFTANQQPDTTVSDQPNSSKSNEHCSNDVTKHNRKYQKQINSIDKDELCGDWCICIKKEIPTLDGIIHNMQAQEKRMKAQIKRESEYADLTNYKRRKAIYKMAKSVVQQNQRIAKVYSLKTDMNSILIEIRKQQESFKRDEMYLIYGYTNKICGNLNVPDDIIKILSKYYKLDIFGQPSDVISKLMDNFNCPLVLNNMSTIISIKCEMIYYGFIIDLCGWHELNDDVDEPIDKMFIDTDIVMDKNGDPPRIYTMRNDESEESKKRICDECDDESCNQCVDNLRRRIAMLQ